MKAHCESRSTIGQFESRDKATSQSQALSPFCHRVPQQIKTQNHFGYGAPKFWHAASNIGHGKLDFFHVKANISARVPKNLGRPRQPQEVNSGTRELTLKCKLKCYFKPMNIPLGVSPSKGKQGTTRGKEKNLLTSVGIEPTTYGLDLPSLCRLSYSWV